MTECPNYCTDLYQDIQDQIADRYAETIAKCTDLCESPKTYVDVVLAYFGIGPYGASPSAAHAW